MSRLQGAQQNAAASNVALDRATAGVVLMDAFGQVVFVNRAARRIMEERDDFALRLVKRGEKFRLVAREPRLTAWLDQAMAARAGARTDDAQHERGIAIPGRSGKRYFIRLSPLPVAPDLRSARGVAEVMMFLIDPDARVELNPLLLNRLYGLTPAEAKLAELIASGVSVKQAAEESALSENTVKTHWKRVFRKVGVSTQADLVAVLAKVGSITP
jgi:DNA-binding CsgD family transcriptional regulator